MKRKHILLLTLIVWVLASTASAVLHEDDFNATLEGDNRLLAGGGTGWNNGEWIYYHETDWWNQWFYDDPPSWDRWKHIDYVIDIFPIVFTPDYEIQIKVALNWSNMEYPATGEFGDPPASNQEWAIEREVILPLTNLAENQPVHLDGWFEILDYNPEWVSIDVWVYTWGVDYIEIEPGVVDEIKLPPQVEIFGEIIHKCIPEPTTMVLLGLGALALLRKKP